MSEKIIYQSERTKGEIVNELSRIQRLEEPLDEPQQFILDKEQELFDELQEVIEAEDESRLKKLRRELQEISS